MPKDIKVTWDYGDNWGKIANILDFDTGTMFHSTNAVQEGQALIYDLQKIYDLDRIEYTPRQDNKGNGTVQKMDVYTSLDGTNWNLAYDSSKNKEWTYSNDMSEPDKKHDISNMWLKNQKVVFSRQLNYNLIKWMVPKVIW